MAQWIAHNHPDAPTRLAAKRTLHEAAGLNKPEVNDITDKVLLLVITDACAIMDKMMAGVAGGLDPQSILATSKRELYASLIGHCHAHGVLPEEVAREHGLVE